MGKKVTLLPNNMKQSQTELPGLWFEGRRATMYAYAQGTRKWNK